MTELMERSTLAVTHTKKNKQDNLKPEGLTIPQSASSLAPTASA
jgi:hypothetical protein